MHYKKYSIVCFFFILITGTLLHFTYEWSGGNTLVSYFSAVNESVWEHLKLIYWPALVFSLYEYYMYGKERCDFFAIKSASVLAGLLFTVTFFYTYSGILGFNFFIADILTFILADFLCCYVSYRLLEYDVSAGMSDSLKGIAVLVLLAVCFIIWTANPPQWGIFL